MNENPVHGHVTSLCRHCLHSDLMVVESTLEKANEFMYKLPQEFDRMADDLPANKKQEIFILRNAVIRRYDEDVYRVRIGTHDLVITSFECHDDFAACKEGFRQYMMMKVFESQAKEALAELFGMKEEKNPEQSKEQMDNTFRGILDQLDLPEDFFGTGGPH